MQTVDGAETATLNTHSLALSWANDENNASALISVGQAGLGLEGTGTVMIFPSAEEGQPDNTLGVYFERTVVAGGWLQFSAGPRSGIWPYRPATAEDFSFCPNVTTGNIEMKVGGVWYTLNKTAVT
jgi:hypothetical protein